MQRRKVEKKSTKKQNPLSSSSTTIKTDNTTKKEQLQQQINDIKHQINNKHKSKGSLIGRVLFPPKKQKVQRLKRGEATNGYYIVLFCLCVFGLMLVAFAFWFFLLLLPTAKRNVQ